MSPTTTAPAMEAASPMPALRRLVAACHRWMARRQDEVQIAALDDRLRRDIGMPPTGRRVPRPDWHGW